MSDSPVCVDASFVLRLLQSDTRDAPAARLWGEWHAAGRSLIVPALLSFELTNALYRYLAHGELTRDEIFDLLEAALSLGIKPVGTFGLHRRALDLAISFSLPAAYHAHYLALSEHFGAEFWTADRRLAQSVRDRLPWIHLIPEASA